MSFIEKLTRQLNQRTSNAVPKLIINKFIGEYGEVVEISINAKSKSIDASILLHGERAPIAVRIDKYELVGAGEFVSFVVKAASSDRTWLNAVLKNFVIEQSRTVPKTAVPVLKSLLG